MTIGARGLTTSLVLLLLCLGACTPSQQQQWRTARDNTLGWFGVARKPAVAQTQPQPVPATAARPADDEPVPSAAPRAPVETEIVPPPAGRS